MGKTYKVHRFFDVDEMTLEKPCECSAPESGYSIRYNWENATEEKHIIFNAYNLTRGGSIFVEGDIVWSDLKKSECDA